MKSEKLDNRITVSVACAVYNIYVDEVTFDILYKIVFIIANFNEISRGLQCPSAMKKSDYIKLVNHFIALLQTRQPYERIWYTTQVNRVG